LRLPRAAAYVLSGRGAPPWLLRAHDVDRIEIDCDVPLPLQVDGEDLGDVEHALFQAEREALPVLV
jgi:diacylglycerol kinase family enzyme